MIGRTVGHYLVLARLGGGGMGVVYKAEDLTLGRFVALKFLPPELTRDDDARKRFLREARAASQLDHANICTVYQIGESDGQTWIAMGFYDGETLKARVERGALEVREVIGLGLQIARGLLKAHASGIVHRDIKPANVMLTREGVAKIVDFGLAKLSGSTHITQSTQMVGTLAYMAPEQLAGETIGPQADLWALGATLFELLTGTRPFRGESAQAVAYAILNEQPQSLAALRPDAPPALERIVKKLLRKDPLQRYQTADEVIDELVALASDGGAVKSGPRVTAERELLRSGAKLGPYEIVEPLGSGGMGDVYKARDTRLDRQVAIKVLAPEFSEDAERRQRFQREAKTISSLSHASICTLFDVGEQEGTDFLVMEFLEGETLAARLARGPLKLGELLKIGIQIAEALGRAHQQGVVHRDLKPANVMLTASGVVKLVDFGLAKGIAEVLEGNGSGSGRRRSKPASAEDATEKRESTPSPEKPLTAEGAIVGTLPYMAPEQVEGKEADARSDIFALGAILYEMATGRRAFEGATKASLVAAILEKEPPLLEALASGSSSSSSPGRHLAPIERVVRQCLEKDPERRWQSALDVGNELRWVEEQGRMGESGGFPGSAKKHLRRWRAGAVTCLALLLVTLGIAVSRELSVRERQPLRAAKIPKLVPLTWEQGAAHTPRLSPDGSSFIYLSDVSGNQDIYYRRIGSGVSVNLTKDCKERDGWPSFSPDGQSIAFRSDRDGGGIFIMGTTGESVRRLTDFGEAPDWSPDGKSIAVMVWDSSVEGVTPGIWIVDVASGTRRKIHDGLGYFPVWSPSGARIAYTGVRAKATDETAVWTIPAAGGDPRELVTGMTGPYTTFLSWGGEWIWYKAPANGIPGIWRIRVDEATGAALGPPELVFRQTIGSLNFHASRDGTRIAFSSPYTGVDGIVRHELDTERGRIAAGQKVLLATGRVHYVQTPSPDGEWLATWIEETLDGQSDIVLVSTSTGETRRLTHDSLWEYNLVWAPDGSKIYFALNSGGRVEVWSIHPDGSHRERVATAGGPRNVMPSVASPDGRALLVWGEEPERSTIAFRVDLTVPFAGRRLIPLAKVLPNRNFWPFAWSPDGRWIVGTATDDQGNPDPVVTLFDVAAGSYRKLAEGPEFAGLAGAAWLPDSRRIVLWEAAPPPGGKLVRLLDRETGGIRTMGTIKNHPLSPQELVVSRDGRTLYANETIVEGDSDVWMLDYREAR